jgi:hypothetical protein
MFAGVASFAGLPTVRPILWPDVRKNSRRSDSRRARWRCAFAQRMWAFQNAAHSRFDMFATATLAPVFRKLESFTSEHGLLAITSPLRPGVWHVRFHLSNQAYVAITFRSCGLTCDVLTDFSIPEYRTVSPTYHSVDLAHATEGWVQEIFEQTLELFVESVVDGLPHVTYN